MRLYESEVLHSKICHSLSLITNGLRLSKWTIIPVIYPAKYPKPPENNIYNKSNEKSLSLEIEGKISIDEIAEKSRKPFSPYLLG